MDKLRLLDALIKRILPMHLNAPVLYYPAKPINCYVSGNYDALNACCIVTLDPDCRLGIRDCCECDCNFLWLWL